MEEDEKVFNKNIRIKFKTNNHSFADEVKLLKKKLEHKIQSTESCESYLDYLISIRNDNSSSCKFNKKDQQERQVYSSCDEFENKRIILPPLDNPEFSSSPSSLRTVQKETKIKKRSLNSKSKRLVHSQNKMSERIEQNHGDKSENLANSFLQPSFEKFFKKLNEARDKRKKEDLESACNHLRKQNRFFTKLSSKLSLCMLKIGFFHELNPGQVLYNSGYNKRVYYIILDGVISLTKVSVGMKKLCSTGETIGEEMLFLEGKITMLETAKAVIKSYVLEIKISDHSILEQETKQNDDSKILDKLRYLLGESFTLKNVLRNKSVAGMKKRFITAV